MILDSLLVLGLVHKYYGLARAYAMFTHTMSVNEICDSLPENIFVFDSILLFLSLFRLPAKKMNCWGEYWCLPHDLQQNVLKKNIVKDTLKPLTP